MWRQTENIKLAPSVTYQKCGASSMQAVLVELYAITSLLCFRDGMCVYNVFVHECIGHPPAHQRSGCNGLHAPCSDQAHAQRDTGPQQSAISGEYTF